MKNKKMRRILATLVIVLVLATGAVFGIANFLVNYAIGRAGDGGNRQVALDVEVTVEGIEKVIADNQTIEYEENKVFLEDHKESPVQIESADGLLLNGAVYENGDSHRWVIAIHGYRSRHEHMNTFVRHYVNAGFQVLTPDLRACGASEGDYVGMGWPDRKDILKWIDYIVETDPQAEIVIHGISMGAATTMMTSGEETADNVKVFVEDCGYTSVWDIFSSELKLRFHLPTFPILNVASWIATKKAGYDFTEASSLSQVSACQKPMLFIHGTADDFIPYDMMGILYDAKPGDNKLSLTVEGAGHGQAMYPDPETYWNTVFDFIDEYMPLSE